MSTIPDEICTYEEVYGFVRELEERVLYMKKDDYSWGGDDLGERTRNSLYALSLLASLNGPLDKRYTQQLDFFLKEAEARYLSDRQYVLPLVLGLYVSFKHFEKERSNIVKKLIDILHWGEKEVGRLSFGVEYLFCITFFLDLLESDIEEDVIQPVVTKAKELAISISTDYNAISDDETKVKLLYSLAVLPQLQETLRNLYDKFKGDIEDLSERVRREDLKVLLIRSYMLLGVRCNRKIVFDLRKYFQENRFVFEERRIRQRLIHFFLYFSNIKEPDIEIQELEPDRFKVSFALSKEGLLSLQKQIPGIPFICRIALALCNAGFKHIYTIPGRERKEYEEFKKSKETGKYLRVKRKGINEILEDATDCSYQIMISKGAVLLVASVILAIIGAIVSLPALVVAPVIAFIISQLLAVIPQISQSGYALASTLIKKKDHKKRIRQRLERMLG